MKQIKKIAALALALIMVLAMSSTAFADGVGLANDDAVESTNEVVRIVKEITVYNPENATVNEPTASYKYTVTADSASKSVKDANGVQVVTKAGVGVNTIKMSSQTDTTASVRDNVTLTWTADGTNTLTASITGTANTKWIDIDFSGVNFGAAGVYRYVITESDATYTSNGVVKGTTGHVRYLDVYVKDAATQSAELNQASDWDVYGYALFTGDDNIDANTDPKETKKTTGFVAHTDGTDAKTADQYYTFNLVVGKSVENDAYTKTTHHQFPFTITLTNGTVTANVLPIMTVSTNATQTALTANAIAGTWTPTIADGATVTYVGIPTGTTITIKEKNDVVGTTYQVKSTGADTELAAANVYYDNESGVATVSAGATAGSAVSANKTVTFTNTLQQISPTGYVVRIAPYALMLGAGLALLLVVRRRKENAEEA